MQPSGFQLVEIVLTTVFSPDVRCHRGERMHQFSCSDSDGGGVRMSKYEQIIDLLSDGEWHTKDDLGEVTVFPELWLDELRHEPAVEIVNEDETVKVKLLAAS